MGADLADRGLTYEDVGATRPVDERWSPLATGFRVHEQTVLIGSGPQLWEATTATLMEWGVIVSVGPLRIREPVRIVAVVDRPDRCGFAYGTLEGHPVSGEEAFVVRRTPDGEVYLTLRSLTRPAPRGPWRVAFPALLVAQRF